MPESPLSLWTDGVDTVVASSAEEAARVCAEYGGPPETGEPRFVLVPEGRRVFLQMNPDDLEVVGPGDPSCCSGSPGHRRECPRTTATRTAAEWCRWWWDRGFGPGLLGSTEF